MSKCPSRTAGSDSAAKFSIVISGHKSSISLEPEFWEEFKKIAAREKLMLCGLADLIDRGRDLTQNLSSAIRVFILEDTMARARASEKRAIESEGNAEALRRTINSLILERDRAAKTRGGLAPMNAVIARGRANG